MSDGTDTVTLENYDDNPASDGEDSKTPDDFVTVDIATGELVHYQARS